MSKVKGASTLASTPSSSSLAPRHQSPTTYLKGLSGMHDALSKMTEEVPDSRPPSPSRQSEQRVEKLREKVKEAYSLAGGDPAQGKWGHMANLLRMTCTAPGYRRWGVGVRRRSQEIGRGRVADWASLETEQSWFDWDRDTKRLRDREDARLKAKVETWKATIDAVPDPNFAGVSIPVSSDVMVASDGTTVGWSVSQLGEGRKAKGKTRDAKDQPLGFPVVKRSSLSAPHGKGKGKGITPGNDNDDDPNAQGTGRPGNWRNSKVKSTPPVPTRLGRSPAEPQPVQLDSIIDLNMISPGSPEHAKSDPNITPSAAPKRIGDLSEFYLPPSFPSQLGKSTPGPGKVTMQPPTARKKPPSITPQPQLSLSSPPLSLLVSPQSNPRPCRSSNNSSPQPLSTPTRKRARPLTPPSDNILFAGSRAAPRTLKKARTMPSSTVPRSISPKMATDLKSGSRPNDKTNMQTTPKRQLPTLTDLLRASARKGKVPVRNTAKDKGKPASSRRSASAAHSDHSVPQPGQPAFTQNPGAFAPDIMSTQPRGTGFLGIGSWDDNGGIGSTGTGTAMGAGSGDFFGIGYDSQFDLEKHADRVSELLERDVDFAGWLKQMPEDEADE